MANCAIRLCSGSFSFSKNLFSRGNSKPTASRRSPPLSVLCIYASTPQHFMPIHPRIPKCRSPLCPKRRDMPSGYNGPGGGGAWSIFPFQAPHDVGRFRQLLSAPLVSACTIFDDFRKLRQTDWAHRSKSDAFHREQLQRNRAKQIQALSQR